ncbi:MAG: methylenetetrahydrofolate reductase C-terminal domain-containing protein [Thermodesulfobacteriota bacterium]
MIVGERKPLSEIRDLLGPAGRVLIVGCGTCVAVCLAGGEKEANILASQLKMASGLEGRRIKVDTTTLERQCDREFLEPLARTIADYEAVVSLACGAGVQLLAEKYPDRPVYPGVNTRFIGVAEGVGTWTERCRACGQCLLGVTAGVCPVTRCAKGLLNGPCGGQTFDHCETDPERTCAWITIYDRLQARDRLDLLTRLRPPLDYAGRHRPDSLVHPAYKRRFSVDDEAV